MAEVQIKATHIIKPAEKTWTGTMKLSEFDMVVAKGYIPVLYLYEPNKDWVDPATISTTLRESLGKVLVHFYPLVGRLKPLEGGRLELEVDEATWGIPLVEAETAVEMAELGDLEEAEDKGRLHHLFPVVEFMKPIQEKPLVMVQLTHFRCGGVGLCITACHAVLDGLSASHFYTEWTSELGDLEEAEDKGRLHHLFPVVEFMKPIQEKPLVMVQLTHFRCGGVGLCITTCHAVLDGLSASHFYTEWTRLARGEALGLAPLYDRSLLRAGELPRTDWVIRRQEESPLPRLPLMIPPPPPSDFPADGPPPPPPAMPAFMQTTALKLVVSKSQINKLKQTANEAAVNGHPYSSFEALTAHTWRCASKAKGHEGDRLNAVAVAIDVRKRITPPLPRAFNGNAVIVVAATSESGDLNSKPLGYACSKIRQTVEKVTEDLIWANVDYLKSLKDIGEWHGLMTAEGDFVNPDIMMTSWMNLSFKKLDFGWGGEAHMASTPPPMDGMACLRAGRDEGSAVVALCLQAAHAHKFKEYFFHEL